METINFKEMIKKRIIIWTLCSVSFVIGLPIMIVALVNLNWFVGIPFLVLVVFNVIALPIGWTFLGLLVIEKNIAKAITIDQVYHVRDLSIMFGKKDKIMKQIIISLITKRYITGYKFNPQGTELINLNDESIYKGLCKYCNAPVPHKARTCPYCNALVE